MIIKRAIGVLCLGLFMASCSGNNPTAPTTTQPASTATAVLTVSTFTVTAEVTATETVYIGTLQLRETSGVVGAALTAMSVAGSNGARWTTSIDSTDKITAGGTLRYSLTMTDSQSRAPADQLVVSITFTDNNGRTGSLTGGSSAVMRVQFYSLVGFVRNPTTGRGISGSVVDVSDGPNLGKSATADGNGYYVFPKLQSGSFTIRASASGFDATAKTISLNSNLQVDLAVAVTPPDVEYQVTTTGTVNRVGIITYAGAGNSTLQVAGVGTPWSYAFTARSGDFLYISAQNESFSNQCVTVSISIRGSIYRAGTSCGAFTIASVQGSR